MSSSDVPQHSLRGFWIAGTIAFVLTLAAYCALVVTVDPLGTGNGNALCPAGTKMINSREARPLLARRGMASTILLGTSRVERGFDAAALDTLGDGPQVNLGIANGMPADWQALLADASAVGLPRRVYIGADFVMMSRREGNPVPEPIAEAPFPQVEEWHRAYFSQSALLGITTLGEGCRPAYRRDGSMVTPERTPDFAGPEHLARAETALGRRLALDPAERRIIYQPRRELMRQLITGLREQDVEVVLFAAPYNHVLRGVYDRLGMAGEIDWFNADLAALAEELEIAFVDRSDAATILQMGVSPCADGTELCHFFDLTHYDRELATALARELRVAGDSFYAGGR